MQTVDHDQKPNANSVDHNQKPHSVASDLGLLCLLISLLWDTRHKWVKRSSVFLFVICMPCDCGGVLWCHVCHPCICPSRSVVHLSIFSFPDNNLGKYQWIFTKLGVCIDTVEIRLGLLMGKFLSVFDSYLPAT